MLHELIEYGRTHGLITEPGFSPKTAKWAVEVDSAGCFIEVHPLGDEKSGRRFDRCPDLTFPELIGGREIRSHFLVATADVVALYTKDDESADEIKKAEQKHEFFVRMLREASEAVPGLAPAAKALVDSEQLGRVRARLKVQKAKSTDKVTLFIDGTFPVESSAWHDWWRSFRERLGCTRREAAPSERRPPLPNHMVCFMTGEVTVPVPTHEKIVGLSSVGGLAPGDAFVCFDKDSFTSYGLAQSANAAMSAVAAKAYREALNVLIRDHREKVPGAFLVHWFKERIPEQDDPLAWLVEPPAQQERAAQQAARELLRAIETGARAELSTNRYFALTLSGAAGRVMVRDWMEGSFQELLANVSAWFEDLEIVSRDGTRLAFAPKFLAVLGALARDLSEVPARESTALFKAALGGRRWQIPFAALAKATGRARIDFLTDEPSNHARMGLIRAFHVRQNKGGVQMSPFLNEEHPDAAYHCGRLLAILARLQRSALGDVGAGVVQRYYTATSQAPALMIGRLIANAKNHLNKLDPGLARWYEAQIGNIAGRIGDRAPRTLDLERQSLFALGYYQQLAHDRAGKGANEEKEEDSNV